jgi:site-specific recombinase XerD
MKMELQTGEDTNAEARLDIWMVAARKKLTELGLVTVLIAPAQTKGKSARASGSGESKIQGSNTGSKVKEKLEILDDSLGALPQDLDVAAGTELFLATLGGKSRATARTYRTGCRRFWTFLYETGRGEPPATPVVKLPASILERYYEWLLAKYGANGNGSAGGNSSGANTIGIYMASARNLFEYLASRAITPGNVQYQQLIARLGKLQARSSGYRTPRALRTKGNLQNIEKLARLAIDAVTTPPFATSITETENTATPLPKTTGKQKQEVPEQEQVKLTYSARRQQKAQAELERQTLEEARNLAIVIALYTTGMRRHELTALNRADLEDLINIYRSQSQKAPVQSSGTIGISGSTPKIEVTNQATAGAGANEGEVALLVYELIIRGKGGKERLAYWDAASLEAIDSYLKLRAKDSYHPLFIQHHRGRDRVEPGDGGENYRVGVDMLGKIVANFAQAKLGIKLRPHDFRHNLATTLLNAGAKLEEVQDILGHSSPVTTKLIYAHYSQSHLRDVFARYRG